MSNSLFARSVISSLFFAIVMFWHPPLVQAQVPNGCTPLQLGWAVGEAASIGPGVRASMAVFRAGKWFAGCTGIGLVVLGVIDLSMTAYNEYQYRTTWFASKLSDFMQQAMTEYKPGELNVIEAKAVDLFGNETGTMTFTLEIY